MVAIEKVDQDLADIVNRCAREKHEILKEKQQEGPTPKQLPRADRPDQSIRGVDHTDSDGKRWRAWGKTQGREAEKHRQWWIKGWLRSESEYHRLLRESSEAWDKWGGHRKSKRRRHLEQACRMDPTCERKN